MRSLVLSLVAVVTLVSPRPGTEATWVDSAQASGDPISSLTLEALGLGCSPSGLSAVVGWTPSTVPTALTYTAQIVSPSSALTPVSNAVTISPGLLDGLLGGLLGSPITVRVTATLPGTSWTVTADRTVYYKLIIAVPTVSCTP